MLSLAVALAVALTLAACGTSTNGTGSSGKTSSGSHNRQDVTFATDMIPHHQQAIAMARMARTHATSPEVKTLAGDIEAAQRPEIEQMSGWLRSWGEDVPSSSMGGMGGMDGSDDDRDVSDVMPGMMSNRFMDRLGNADGTAFDQMWLRGMIIHHEGAVKMAETETSHGKNGSAVGLARDIKTSQTREIKLMRSLLSS